MSDVTISYKGSPIATMDASGTKTLQTQGKYCEGNITVQYAGGGGSSITVEPLTVTQNGTTTAPSGKAYSPITVNVHPTKIIDKNGKLSNIIAGTQSEFSEINSLIGVRKIFAFVRYEFNGTPVGMALMQNDSSNIIGMAFNTDGTMANTIGVMINWNISGTVTAIALMGGQLQDLSSYAPMIDANLRVYGTTPIGG